MNKKRQKAEDRKTMFSLTRYMNSRQEEKNARFKRLVAAGKADWVVGPDDVKTPEST